MVVLAPEQPDLIGIAPIRARHSHGTDVAPRRHAPVRRGPAPVVERVRSTHTKRVVDVVLSALLLALAVPMLVLIALAIWLEDRGPVLFRQVRLGCDRRPFQICKFRTMTVGSETQLDGLREHNEVEGPLFKMAADPRCTRVGRFLRRWSLDELPQLWNVLVGDMSLVGPRPPLPSEVSVDGFHQLVRLRVRPGMTGPWQVSGRSLLSYDQMVVLDVEYVRTHSLAVDLGILLRTARAVLTCDGAY